MRQYIRFSSLRQFRICHWNVAGTLHSPKDMQSHSKKPRLPTMNVVYCFDDSSILICQNLYFRSKHENDQHLPNSPVLFGSSMVGRSLSSCRQWDSGSLYKSAGLHPSFKPAPLHYTMHSGWGGLHLNSTSLAGVYRGICPNCSLNRVLSVTLITCSVKWVQPSLLGSKEKTLWYSAKRLGKICQLWLPGFQPTQIYLLKQFFLTLLHGQFGVRRPWASSNVSILPVCIGSSGTCVATTALATDVLFLRVWGYAVLFLTSTGKFLLPLHNSV